MRDYIKIINRYAADVVSSKIDACTYVKQACQRHLKDLKAAKSSAYYFSEEKAIKICKFIEKMPHTKGVWQNTLIELQPWQIFIWGNVFGWCRKEDNRRKYREVYIEVPRKNGKSIIVATIGLYMMTEEGEAGAEIYCGATTEKQAHEVFIPAKMMASRLPKLREYYGVEVNASSLTILKNGSKFIPVIAKPGDGPSPSCAIVDEFHEHDVPVQYNSFKTGMGARTEPLLIITTTAGIDISGPCYDKRDQVLRVLQNPSENEALFGIVYTIDQEDDWRDIKNWKKANPNYNVSVFKDYMEAQLKDAMQRASLQNINKTKHLNLWQNAGSAFFNMEDVEKCTDKSIDISDFKGQNCIIALDLASKLDLCCLMCLFWNEKEEFTAFSKFYLAAGTVELPENSHYRAWENEDALTVTPGAVTDYEFIKRDLLQLCADHAVINIAYDPFQATQFYTEMDKLNLPMIEIRPNVLNFSEPMLYLESLLKKEYIKFNDKVLSWMFANTIARYDAKGCVYPRKEREQNKIDGVVALIMCLNRYISGANQRSVYETQGLTVL